MSVKSAKFQGRRCALIKNSGKLYKTSAVQMFLCVLLKTTLPRGYRRVNAIDAEVLTNQKTLPKLLSRSSARGHQEVIDLRQEVVHKKTHAIHKLFGRFMHA
jgi:hypothetical protein